MLLREGTRGVSIWQACHLAGRDGILAHADGLGTVVVLAGGAGVLGVVPGKLGHGQVVAYLLLRHLRVENVQVGIVPEQPLAHVDGGRLSRVPIVLPQPCSRLKRVASTATFFGS